MKGKIRFKISTLPLVRYVYWRSDSSPKRCPYCLNTKFNDIPTDHIDHTVCERSIVCSKCDREVSYWAYGAYVPI